VVVTDEQVATLRAQLAGDFDEHKRLYGRLDRAAAQTGYTALIAGAFYEAVERRFAESGTSAEVVGFVGDVRSRSSQAGEKIDPRTAERLIRAVYTDEEIDDLDAETVIRTQMLILAALVADEQFDGAELDDFVTKARKLADRLMG
jgi:hypothetical protein